MSDTLLMYGAITIEAGILVALVVICVRSANYRKHAIVAIGSVAPILYFYVSATVAFVRDPRNEDARFAFYAMWIMGFLFFLICVSLGLAVAQLPRPKHLALRFLLGAAVTSGLYGLIVSQS